MQQKIKYRLVYNYGGKLGQDGTAPIALEMRQGERKAYISSRVLVTPEQWEHGSVVNHDNGEKLTVYLVKWRNQIEEIELNALLRGRSMSLSQLKHAVKSGVHESANLKDFTLSVVNNSTRKQSTKRGYEYLMKDLEKDYGRLQLDDITYDWIMRWRAKMQQRIGLSANTIKGRMKLMRCIINEAVKRNLISEDPFKYITIGNMTPKAVWLTMKEIRKIERLQLKGKAAVIRDLFLFGCYSGLRWSDLSTLEEATVKDGVLTKVMKKTNHAVSIPISTLFWGKDMEILNRYPNIRRLSHVCCNATANRTIKEIAHQAGINKDVSFHWARKSCSSNLQLLGMSIGDVSTILGHTDVQVTSTHYSFSREQSAQQQSKKIFRQKVEQSSNILPTST